MRTDVYDNPRHEHEGWIVVDAGPMMSPGQYAVFGPVSEHGSRAGYGIYETLDSAIRHLHESKTRTEADETSWIDDLS